MLMALNLGFYTCFFAETYQTDSRYLILKLRQLQECSSNKNAIMAEVNKAITSIQERCGEEEKICNDLENKLACVGFLDLCPYSLPLLAMFH